MPYRQQVDTIKNKYPTHLVNSHMSKNNNYSYRPKQELPQVPQATVNHFQLENRSLGLIPKISPKITMVSANQSAS